MTSPKRSFHFIFVAAALMSVAITNPAHAKMGDVNNDGQVDITDALRIAQCLNGKYKLDMKGQYMADVNLDSEIDMLDAELLSQYYVGLITRLPYNPAPVEPGNDASHRHQSRVVRDRINCGPGWSAIS